MEADAEYNPDDLIPAQIAGVSNVIKDKYFWHSSWRSCPL